MKVLEIFKYYFHLGATCFGGPLAVIANMRNDLVERRKWITENEFENYFGYSQIAPGPIAFQVCLYVGYFRAGVLGAMAAGFAWVLPSFLIVLLFSIFYKEYGNTFIIAGALYGISPVIVSIISYSGLQLAGRVFKKDYFLYLLFAASLILTAFLKFPIMYVIIGSGVVSLMYYSITKQSGPNTKISFMLTSASVSFSANYISSFGATLRAFAENKFLEMSLLFMKVGALTYGSGFVIVGVLNQEAVNHYGYITAKEFIDGLAFGQITPGPVVITSTFIGYLTEGIPGAIICTISIFLPTFLLVMFIANFIHKVSENFYVKSLIKGANAAAIGAILATAYLISDEAVKDYFTGAFALVSLFLLFKFKFKSLYLIIIAGILGMVIYAFDVS